MIYTVRYAHLAETPFLKAGDKLNTGDFIGKMGSTGQSTGAHLHIDVVEGAQSGRYTLADMEFGKQIPSPRQLNWFIDNGLFLAAPVVTTPYCDAEYMIERGKLHLGYDLIPLRGGEGSPIYWNRSMVGTVLSVVRDKDYGNMVQIAFEVT